MDTLLDETTVDDEDAVMAMVNDPDDHIYLEDARLCGTVGQKLLIRQSICNFFGWIFKTPNELLAYFGRFNLDILALEGLPQYTYRQSNSYLEGDTEEKAVDNTSALSTTSTTPMADAPTKKVPFNRFRGSICVGADTVTYQKSPLVMADFTINIRTTLHISRTVKQTAKLMKVLEDGYVIYLKVFLMFKYVAFSERHIGEVTYVQPWVQAIMQFVANSCNSKYCVRKWKEYCELSARVTTVNGPIAISGYPDLECVTRVNESDEVYVQNLENSKKEIKWKKNESAREQRRCKIDIQKQTTALYNFALGDDRMQGVVEVKVPRIDPLEYNDISTGSQNQMSAQLISLQRHQQGRAVCGLLTDGFSGCIMVLAAYSEGLGHRFYRTAVARNRGEMLNYYIMMVTYTASELVAMLKPGAVKDDDMYAAPETAVESV